MNPTIRIAPIGKKFSVRIEFREESYQLVDSFDDLVELLKREFHQKDGREKR